MILPGFHSAGDQVFNAAAHKYPKAVYVWDVKECPHFPVVLPVRRNNDDFCLCSVMGGEKFLCRQKLSVRLRNMQHRHHTTRLCPDRILVVPNQVIQGTSALPLRGDQEMFFSTIK